MSTEQPVPPSIPPRRLSGAAAPAAGRTTPTAPPAPDAGAGRRPAAASAPHDDAGAATPAGTTGAPAADESVLAGSRARAAAAGGAAAGAVRRVVRGATAAAVAAASSSGDAPHGTTTGAGGVPRAADTEGDPTIAATDDAARTGAARSAQPAPDTGPRRVRLNLSRVDPWSVMKLSFLLSFAIGIMIVVAAVVVWFALDSLAVFTTINDMLTEIVGEESPIDILGFLDLSRVVSGAFIVAIVDVILLTALSTIGAFLYNITAALVGGISVTLTDE